VTRRVKRCIQIHPQICQSAGSQYG